MSLRRSKATSYVCLVLGAFYLTSIRACFDGCTNSHEDADSAALSICGPSQPVLWIQVDRFTRIYNYSFTDYDLTAKFECVLGIEIMPQFRLIFYLDGNIVAFTDKDQSRLHYTFSLHKSNNNITCQAQRVLNPTGRVYLKSVILLDYIPLLETSTIPTIESTRPEPVNETTEQPSTTPAPSTASTTTVDTGTTINTTWVVAAEVALVALIAVAVLIACISKCRCKVQPRKGNKTFKLEGGKTPLNPPPEIVNDHISSHGVHAYNAS